ncbi:MAG: hypothetical protein ACR2ID_06195 [Chthoniobacterales bacterium]
MSAMKPVAPAVCPVCGEDVPRGVLACPECGADHRSGWREEGTNYDGVGLPEEFDYDAFVQDEFGTGAKPRGIAPIWWITAILLVLAFAAFYLYAAAAR